MHKFTQPQIAVLVGVFLSLGLAIPASLPAWNGSHMPAFLAAKELTK